MLNGVLRIYGPRNKFALLLLTLFGFWCMKHLIEIGSDEARHHLTASLTRQNWRNTSSHGEDINLAFVLHNRIYIEQFWTLMKNILYYQGRNIQPNTSCALNLQTIQNHDCPKSNPKEIRSLHLHLLTTDVMQTEVMSHFLQWNLSKVLISFHDWSTAVSQTQNSGRSLTASNLWTMRMLWPELLGDDVKKVVSLDTDLLFNQNIEKLWDEFNEFRDQQMVGGILEQWDHLQKLPSSRNFPVFKSGINGGVVLLHLEKIRRTNWTQWWRQVENEMKASGTGVPYGDQGIINTLLYRRPEIFHEVPCEWNYIPNDKNFKDYCPVSWVVRIPNRSNCLPPLQIGNQTLRLVSIVHFAGNERKRFLRIPYHGNPRPVKDYREFDEYDLKNTFKEVFYAFKRMDTKCFS